MEPLIVFDGGYDPDDRKLPTILQRMSDRRDNVWLVCRTDHGTVPPILAVETFRQVLVEFGIKHVTCDFEADDDIGVLANDLDCPVMSNDSDFFVYDLKTGFIPLDYINLTLCVHNTDTDVDYTCTKDKELNKNEYMYIPVKFYHRDTFVKLVGNKEAFVIPLLATLLGNDYLYASNLQGFYATLTLPATRLRYNYSPKSQSRLAALIEWLSDKSDLDSCVELVVAQLKADRRNMVRKEIYKSVKSYTNTEKHASAHLKSLLDASHTNDENTPTEACNQTVCDYFGNKLPNWVLQRLRMHEVHPMLQNIAVLHRVFLLCQVEILKEISTYRCSEFLRHVTYGIIFKPDLNADTKDNRRNCVQEYDREGKNTKKFYVRPAESIPCYGKLPSLADVPEISVEDRQYLLLCSLGVSEEDRSLPCKGRSECRSESLHDTCKDSDLHSDLESCKESGVQSDLVSCKDSDVQPDLISCKESGVQSILESCKELGVQSDHESCKESGVQSDLELCKESGAQSDLKSCKESGVQSDLESCKESGVQSDLKSCKESGVQSDLESCKESGVQSDLESCKDLGVQSDHSSKDLDLDSDLLLLVGTTSFWINNANPQVTAAHLDSLIVSLIVIHVKVLKWIDQRKLQGFDFQKPRLYCHITEAFHKSSDKQIQKLEKNLEKYFVKPNHSHKNPRDNAVVHGFAQLQACMQDVIRLNQLLLCPFAPINPSFIINSTFMYNLCREIDTRLEPDLFIVDMLGKKSPLCLLFLELKERVLSLCKDDCFHEKSCQKKKKKNPMKKERTKVKKDTLPKETKSTEKTDEETAANTATEKKEKKAKLKTKINCSVTNRFAMLDISD